VRVRLTWDQKILGVSLDHLYMLEQLPDSLDNLPPHQRWQCPFVFATPDEPWERLQARARRAGDLWLGNYDFRPHEELIIAHVTLPWFVAFHRAVRPNKPHMVIGPFNLRVLRRSDGVPLFGLPLVYRENAHASGREDWDRARSSMHP
jgi:hypothetical protein